MTDTLKHKPMKLCPYCGNDQYLDSWRRGNAYCGKCKKGFNIVFIDGVMTGVPLEDEREKSE